MTKKRKSKRQQKQRKKIHNKIIQCTILSIFVLGFSYVIFQTDYLEPKINETTASYISFNNKNTTDMLKIQNIQKMSDQKGKSTLNSKFLKIDISGEESKEYEIVLYSIENKIEPEFINIYSMKFTILQAKCAQ